MKRGFFALGIAVLMVSGFCCGAVEGVINASRLNARVFPELKSPSAVKLPRGKKVEIFKRHGAWLEIAAPDITPVFASAAYLHGNKVIRDMNLRIRPDSKSAVVGRVAKGTVLKAVTEPDRYGWVQVAPLPELRLYVMRDYVTFDASKVPVAAFTAPASVKKAEAAPAPAPEKKVEPAPAPAPEKKVETAPVPAPAPAPVPAPGQKIEPAPVPLVIYPAPKAETVSAAAPVKMAEIAPVGSFELSPARRRELINIGTDITTYTEFKSPGRLVAVPQPTVDCTSYALVTIADSTSLGFCFADAPIDLKKMVDKCVEVKGYAYKVSDWKNPVVAVTEIKVIGE